jgi:hypothetical protein
MRTFIVQEHPNEDFWNQYEDLWQNSLDKSSFQAPELLKSFLDFNMHKSVTFQLHVNQKLTGAVIFSKANKTYSFLSDLKSDVNGFVFRQNISNSDIQFFFNNMFENIKQSNSCLILNKIPVGAGFIQQLEISARNHQLFWRKIKYTVCKRVVANTATELFKIINSSSQTRSSVNKIKKENNSLFEVFTDETELESWVSEFCKVHIHRWSGTSTPSVLRDKNKQAFLLQSLKAWNKEKILVRFSIRLDQKRISFVIALIEKNTLIHHSTTFDPDYRKFSPGRSIILFIAKWMADQNYNILDFGNGDEGYKSFFANNEQELDRIFISTKSNFVFMLKAIIIKHVRNQGWLYKLYKEKIKIHLN